MERGVIDHGFRLFAEENRAAAAFWARSLPPLAWTGPTLHTDLAATLFALYGLDATAVSGVPLGEAPADRVRRLFAYSTADYGPPQLAVVREDRVLHEAFDGARSLYRLDVDPAELVDVSADEPETLRPEMDAFVEDVTRTWPHLEPTYP
jgi:hypothetical protein